MTVRRRLVALAVLASTLIFVVGGLAVAFLYRAGIEREREALAEVVFGQTRLVEALFTDELMEAGGDVAEGLAGTLAQLRAAWTDFQGFGETGELTLAERRGDTLVFFLGLREDTTRAPAPIRLPSGRAEPAQWALEGRSGAGVARDYDSVAVVAAYTPVPGTPWGLVAKMDLAEVRAPYVRASVAAAGAALLVLLLGLGAGVTLGSPMVAEVEEREAAHRAILRHFPGVAFRALPQGRGWGYDAFEGASETLTGWPATRFLRDSSAWEALVGEEGMAPLRAVLDAAEGEVQAEAEYSLRRGDGKEVWLRTVVRRGEAPGEERTAVGVHLDVTAERARANAVARAQRALRVRDAVDRVVAGADSREALWDGVCREMTGEGGYPLAWVGVPRADEGRTVAVMASSGASRAYVDEVRVSWAEDEPEGRGPTGAALRTGVSQTSANIPGDPAMRLWSEAALRHGIRSSAAVPIVVDGEVVAVLNVYAPEADGFDQREVELVESAAAAVAHHVALLRKEEERAASETLFREFMEASPAVAWVKDAEGRHLWANRAWEESLGMARSDWEGRKDSEIFPAAVADALRAADRQVSASGRPLNTVEETEDPSGARRTWSAVKFPLAGLRGEARVGGVAVDISGEVRAQEALRRSEERLRLALRAGGHGLYDLDLRTGDAVVNDEYARMLGYDPATFIETNAAWRERLHPDDRDHVYAEFEAYVAGERDLYRVEFRQRTGDGGWKWVLSLGEIVERDAQGRPLRMMGTHTDIHARKVAEEQVRAHLDELRRWQRVMLDREDRIQELKAEVNELCRRAGEAARYAGRPGGRAS